MKIGGSPWYNGAMKNGSYSRFTLLGISYVVFFHLACVAEVTRVGDNVNVKRFVSVSAMEHWIELNAGKYRLTRREPTHVGVWYVLLEALPEGQRNDILAQMENGLTLGASMTDVLLEVSEEPCMADADEEVPYTHPSVRPITVPTEALAFLATFDALFNEYLSRSDEVANAETKAGWDSTPWQSRVSRERAQESAVKPEPSCGTRKPWTSSTRKRTTSRSSLARRWP